MPRPDEGLIHAWLDGELEAAEAARVEKLVAEDAEWAAAAAEARGLIAASSRILGALDVVAGDVIPQGGSAAPAFAPRRAVPSWMKMAAGIVFLAGLGYAGREGIGFTVRDDAAPAAEMVVLGKTNDSSARELSSAPAESEARVREDAARVEPAPRIASAPDRDAVRATAPAAPPPAADAVAPIASMSAAQDANLGAAAGAPAASSSLARSRQAPTDSQSPRRALGDARLEGVVVTGVTGGVANQSAERTSVRSLQPQAAKSAAPVTQPAAALQAEPPPPLPIIEGCFRVRTRALIDTLLVDPKILATDADSIRIEIPSARWAWVRRDSTGALVGRVWWQRGTANMRADPIDCS